MDEGRVGAAPVDEGRITFVRTQQLAGQYLNTVLTFFRKKPLGAFGAFIAVFLIVLAVFAGPISRNDPPQDKRRQRVRPAQQSGLLGGDQLGRDVYSRLVHGAKISLRVGFFSCIFGIGIGFLVGVASAYIGGKFDLVIQRVVDAVQAFPPLILALAIMAALGAAEKNVIFALGLVFIPISARTIRAQAPEH